MTTERDLAPLLIEAQRAGTMNADQSLLAGIDADAAYDVQRAVMAALGETAGMYKVAVAADGSGLIAPIYASRVADSGALQLPVAKTTGLEVEIGVVLDSDLPPGSDRAAVEAAVGRYFLGVEVCGSRYADRSAASPTAALADQMSAFGYVIGGDWPRGSDISGLDVTLRVGGSEIYSAPAKHGFGGVLEALVAYAKLTQQPYPLTAGTVLTTGSMCGLVPNSATGTVVAEFGGQSVTLELV